MKDCINEYRYKGFIINFSEQSQSWRIEPTIKLLNKITNLSDNDLIELATNYNNDSKEFRTITATKKHIKNNYDSIIEEIKATAKKENNDIIINRGIDYIIPAVIEENRKEFKNTLLINCYDIKECDARCINCKFNYERSYKWSELEFIK